MTHKAMTMSQAGLAKLRSHERVKHTYYNDQGNNCTYGTGTLAHYGPCTTQELKRHVTNSQINAALSIRVRAAENAINREVKIPLTQIQFDALVSFTYNVGVRGAASTLKQVNNHKFTDAAKIMNRYVYVHPYKNGKRMPAVRSHGLAKRRRVESAPFLSK